MKEEIIKKKREAWLRAKGVLPKKKTTTKKKSVNKEVKIN